jgi:enamine deaminase RidA (YjgF/YER057c/UK114 family)
LTAGGQKSSSTRSRAALDAAGRILAREGLSVGYITRQWNYLQDILAIGSSRGGSRQNYQEFNERRREFYTSAAFPSGYPAATGIGIRDGGVVIEFRAAAPRRGLRIVPLSSPLQKNAHRYSGEVLVGGFGPGGRPKAAPLFERAKFVGDSASGVVFISGTAAIRGQHTVARGDAAAQAGITIENIRRLISPGNLRRHGINALGRTGPLAYLRAYVRRERDLPAVRSACRAAFGGIPAHFVLADICRDDLLVEMEGVLAVQLIKGN